MTTQEFYESIEVGRVTARIQCKTCKTSAGMTGGDKTVFFDFNPEESIFCIPDSAIENFNKDSHFSGSSKCATGSEINGLEVRYFALDISGVPEDVKRVSVKGLVFKKIREGRFKCVFDFPQSIDIFI